MSVSIRNSQTERFMDKTARKMRRAAMGVGHTPPAVYSSCTPIVVKYDGMPPLVLMPDCDRPAGQKPGCCK